MLLATLDNLASVLNLWPSGENVVTEYRQIVNMLLIVKLLPSL